MYAVIETGGKQYRVEVGTELEVELLDVAPGNTVTIDRVLLVADGDQSTIGRPMVEGAAVSAEVVRQARGEKLIVFKYRPKARSRVKKGHRQELTVLRVSDIVFGGKSAATVAAKAESDAKTERQRLEEAAAAQATKDAELAAKLAAPTTAKAPTAKSTAKADDAKKTTTKAAAAKQSTADADAKTATAAKATAKAKTETTSEPKSTAKSAAKAAPRKAASKSKGDTDAPNKSATKPRTPKKDE